MKYNLKTRWILTLIFFAGCSIAFISVNQILLGFVFEFLFAVWLMAGYQKKEKDSNLSGEIFTDTFQRTFKQ